MTIEDILSRLTGVQHSGNGYTARCPAHDDRHNSLSISDGDKGVVLHCHASCSTEAITAALGLKMSDLFYESSRSPAPAKKSLPRDAKPEAVYIYRDASGREVHRTIRYGKQYDRPFSQARPDPDHPGQYIHTLKGIETVLYNLPAVIKAVRERHPVLFVEGEKDADTLNGIGFTATTNPMGAGSWKDSYNQYLRGADVIIIPDNDDPGRKHLNTVARSLAGCANSVRYVDLRTVYPTLQEHGDVSDYLHAVAKTKGEAQQKANELLQSAILWKEETEAAEWSEPTPFDTASTPDFPTESLPAPVMAFVEALAESTQTPDEMAAILSLGILSTALQSRYTVEVTPDWIEPLCLYPVAIAPPGERKSAVISALSAPVYEYEAARREFEAEEIMQNQAERAMLEKTLANAQTEATSRKKGANPEQARQDVRELTAELARFEDKHPYRLLVDDTTTEKLVDMMDMQGGCITVASAEGGVFDIMAGRYDKSANIDVYLKGHAGDRITVDRIGRKSNNIPHPRLTMLLAIQPEVLNGLMGNATFKGRGLCARFLYVVCKSKVGSRRADPEPIPQKVKDDFSHFCHAILSGTDTGAIQLSAEAHAVRIVYAESVERRLGNEWEYMQDWGGKLVGAMLRIAALIHASECVGDPTETPISADTMTAAVKIAEFLGVHAEAAYQRMDADEETNDAKYLWRRIESTGQNELTKNDVLRLTHGRFHKAEEVEPALHTLEDMAYIRREQRKTGGRPGEFIVVNPFSKGSKVCKAPQR